jgi:lactoylglutathione lyase
MANYWYDHVHLMSPDPLKTAGFYQKMFDAQMVRSRKEPDGRTTVGLSLNGSRLLIAQTPVRQVPEPPSVPPPGLEHFGIKTDDIETTVANLKGIGVRFREDIAVRRADLRVAFFWAPENVLMELVEYGK